MQWHVPDKSACLAKHIVFSSWLIESVKLKKTFILFSHHLTFTNSAKKTELAFIHIANYCHM